MDSSADAHRHRMLPEAVSLTHLKMPAWVASRMGPDMATRKVITKESRAVTSGAPGSSMV